MMRTMLRRAWLLAALLPLALGAATTRLTQRCNTINTDLVLFDGLSADVQQRLASVAAHPSSDPGLYAALWEPFPATRSYLSTFGNLFVTQVDPFQDVAEIVQSMKKDPVIVALGAGNIEPDYYECFSPPPPPPFVTVTEYHNTILDHYFLSSSDAENASIDAGAAGPGWERTGESFRAISDWICYGQVRVFRFYTHGANSHFFTADVDECGSVRRTDPRWIAEGIAFAATVPNNGACANAGDTPVYRLYNNRWMFGDSNHRFTTSSATYQRMIAKGWVGEGVSMCVRQQ